MLNRRRFCWYCLLVLPHLPAYAAAKVLRLVYAQDYPPYSTQLNGKPSGIEIDIADEIFGRRFGFSVQHEILPWARAQLMVENGSADALFATPSRQRLTYASASKEAVVRWNVSMYVRKDDHRLDLVRSLDQLTPFKIAVLHGNSWAMNKLTGLRVEYVPNQIALPRMLIAGRFDVVLEDSYVMMHLLKKDGSDVYITELPHELDSADIHLMLSLKSTQQDLLARFDKEIKLMREDGSLTNLIAKYR
ncbi:substrate-binding periplasmic protein [Undibacterium sp. Ren11W]|uniref:substrate-binding periplasmic protein n=1 Tax=Undibacterium sp. Ren11W TaxID=3413045 RepID=UPI003BF36B6C